MPRTTCPVPDCGAPLEASVVTYLSAVELDDDGTIKSYEVWDGNDSDGRAWDAQGTRVYCSNDHEYEGWMAPTDVTGPFTPREEPRDG